MYNPGVYGGYPQQGGQPQPSVGGYPPQSGQSYPQQGQQQPQGGGYSQNTAPQPQPSPPQVQVYFRPVSSYDEALVVPADVTGALTIMPHLASGMIYTKQLDANCNVDFAVYKRVQVQPAPAAQAPAYDPRQEIDALRGEVEALRGELAEVRRAPGGSRGGRNKEAEA